MSESKFKRRCVELMRDTYGAKVIHIQGGNPMQERGLPDDYVSTALPTMLNGWLNGGWHGWIEFKDTQTVLKPNQKRQLIELNKRNRFTAFLVRCTDGEAGKFMLEYIGFRNPERGFVEGFSFDVLQAVAKMLERYGAGSAEHQDKIQNKIFEDLPNKDLGSA